jgi:hypothetical protein
LTQQALYQRVKPKLPLAEPHWRALLDLAASLPRRLSRTIPGGHFFFVGEPGARATADLILELRVELERVQDELRGLGQGASPPLETSR